MLHATGICAAENFLSIDLPGMPYRTVYCPSLSHSGTAWHLLLEAFSAAHTIMLSDDPGGSLSSKFLVAVSPNDSRYILHRQRV